MNWRSEAHPEAPPEELTVRGASRGLAGSEAQASPDDFGTSSCRRRCGSQRRCCLGSGISGPASRNHRD